MTKDVMLHVVEDLVDSSIPLDKYCVRVYKNNGDCEVHVHHSKSAADVNIFYDIPKFSEIFNSYTNNWYVLHSESQLKIVVS